MCISRDLPDPTRLTTDCRVSEPNHPSRTEGQRRAMSYWASLITSCLSAERCSQLSAHREYSYRDGPPCGHPGNATAIPHVRMHYPLTHWVRATRLGWDQKTVLRKLRACTPRDILYLTDNSCFHLLHCVTRYVDAFSHSIIFCPGLLFLLLKCLQEGCLRGKNLK